MKGWQLLISGRVQGVCFRMAVLRFVEQHVPRVNGFVRNLFDGRVEVVASGELEDLNKLYQFCRQGPPASFVEKVDLIERSDLDDFDNFTISQS